MPCVSRAESSSTMARAPASPCGRRTITRRSDDGMRLWASNPLRGLRWVQGTGESLSVRLVPTFTVGTRRGEAMTRNIERELMAAEYLLDSRAEHAHKINCPAIGKKWLGTIDQALMHIRQARRLWRRRNGAQKTLITVHAKKRPSRATT